MIKRTAIVSFFGLMLSAGVLVAPAFVGADAAYAQAAPSTAAQQAYVTARVQQLAHYATELATGRAREARASTPAQKALLAQALANLEAVMAREQTMLATFLSQNPAAASSVDEAMATLSPADQQSIAPSVGAAMATAVNNLLAAGSTTGAAAINAEVAVLAANPDTAGVQTAYRSTASTLIAGDTAAGANQTAQNFQSLLNTGNVNGGSGSRS